MKNCFGKIMMTLALVLALAVGAVAMAEKAEPETPPQTEQTLPDEALPDQDDALRDALSAYSAAKKASRLAALEEELKGYVEAGQLTQEQADLILKYYSERQSARVSGHTGRGGQLEGRSVQGKGSRMNPGQDMGGRTQRGATGRQRTPGQSNADQSDGTAFTPGMSTPPNLEGTGMI